MEGMILPLIKSSRSKIQKRNPKRRNPHLNSWESQTFKRRVDQKGTEKAEKMASEFRNTMQIWVFKYFLKKSLYYVDKVEGALRAFQGVRPCILSIIVYKMVTSSSNLGSKIRFICFLP
jgi:hypothetical protein